MNTTDSCSGWLDRWHQLNEQPVYPRLMPSTLRAAWWALTTVRRVKRDLRAGGVSAQVQPPPQLPWGSRTGVYGVLNRLEPTCIERSLVQQAWLYAFGVERSVVVGVRKDDNEFRAHAWIEDMAGSEDVSGYRVIHRIPPR